MVGADLTIQNFRSPNNYNFYNKFKFHNIKPSKHLNQRTSYPNYKVVDVKWGVQY